MSDLILYTTEDGRSQIKLRAKDQTVWLTQREMAQLFDVSTDNVGLHLKNIFEDGELLREATTEESSVVQTKGEREVNRPVTLYNLDAILAVGYRVRSPCRQQCLFGVPAQAASAMSKWKCASGSCTCSLIKTANDRKPLLPTSRMKPNCRRWRTP